MSELKLLHCPICGEKASPEYISGGWQVSCTECSCSIGHDGGGQLFPSASEAAEWWNRRASPWIRFEDRKPEIDEPVLFYRECGLVIHDMIDKDMMGETYEKWVNGTAYTGKITHWMPIPPMEEDNA